MNQMTNEEVFQQLIEWAWYFGCDVYDANDEELQLDGHERRRGVFRKFKRVPGRDEEIEIVLQIDLPIEEKVEVLSHEVAHMGIFLLKVEPYQKLTHEPTAELLGRCLVSIIRGDVQQNPLFKVSGMTPLVKQFLELLSGKIERTSTNLTAMNAEYFRWKKEIDGYGG